MANNYDQFRNTIASSIPVDAYPQTGGITPFTISTFIGGLNRLAEDKAIPNGPNCVVDCKNVEFLKNGFIQKAKGYIKFIDDPLNDSNSQCQGMFSFTSTSNQDYLVVSMGDKIYVSNNNGLTYTEIYSGLDPTKRCRFALFTEKLIACNGSEIVEWEIDSPSANIPSWWTYSEIPSIAKVHKNRLFLSGSPDASSRVWASGLQDLNFNASETTSSTGTGTLEIKTSETIDGIGTVSVSGTPTSKAGNGTISGSTTAITGSGTTFYTQLKVGDIITVGAQQRAVKTINSDTSITIDRAFSPSISGQAYTYFRIFGADFTGLGTISSSGVTVTGVGTAFTVHVKRGDLITVGANTREVASVSTDTTLTLTTAFPSSLSAQSYTVKRYGSGTITVSGTGVSGSTAGTGTIASNFLNELEIGSQIKIGEEYRTVTLVTDSLTATIDRAFKKNYTNTTYEIINPSRYVVQGVDTEFFSNASNAGNVTDYQIIIGSETRDIINVSGSGLLTVDEPFDNDYTDVTFQIIQPLSLGTTIAGTGTLFSSELSIGDEISVDGQIRTVTSINSDTEIVIAIGFDPDISSGSSFTILKADNNPGDFFDVNGSDGQIVTAMEVFAENLIIWKNNSIYGLSGSTVGTIAASADPFKLTPISTSTGCINQDSVVPVKNDILFINRYGINSLSLVNRLIQPVTTTLLSIKIQDDIDAWNLDKLDICFGVHYRSKTQVWFFIPGSSTSLQNDKVIVLDYENTNLSIRDGFVGSFGIDYNNKPIIGGYNGYLYQHDTGNSYDGDAIDSYFITPWYPIDNNYLTNKMIKWLALTYVRYGNWNLIVDAGIDWRPNQRSRTVQLNPNSTQATWGTAVWGESTWTGNATFTENLYGGWGMGHAFNFKFSNNAADQPWLIQGFDIYSQTLGMHGKTYRR